MIACRVQHHPSRRHLLPALERALQPLPIQIMEHSSTPPSPWAGYRCCLSDLPDCTHLLVIQDDAVPVPNFVSALRRVAASNPKTPVCLFLARLPLDASRQALRAAKLGQCYITLPLRSFMPVVAVLWPRRKAEEFMAWADEHPQLPGQREPRSDDAMAGRWKLIKREHVRVTVPSIVEHPDHEESLIGRRRAWGRDAGRVALLLAEDADQYPW